MYLHEIIDFIGVHLVVWQAVLHDSGVLLP